MQKLYCYVDESGQHSEGAYFLVSVVIAETDRDQLEQWLLRVEQETGKRHLKWHKSKGTFKEAYIRAVLSNTDLKGKLFSAYYADSREYVEMTIEATAKAIHAYTTTDYKATVLVDGLQKPERNRFAVGLRKVGIVTHKVVGRDDRKDPIIRLADALCGFVADALAGREGYMPLLQKAEAVGIVTRV